MDRAAAPFLALLFALPLLSFPPAPKSPPAPAARKAAAAPAQPAVAEVVNDPPIPPRPPGPAQGCRDSSDEARRAARVNGKDFPGTGGLDRLRKAWGDSLIVVEGGNLSGADFRGKHLRNICFVGTDLSKSDWRDATATGIGFIQSDLSGAWFDRARLPRLLLESSKLDGASAVGADWRGGTMRGSWAGSLKQVRLDGADLRSFRFDCRRYPEDSCVSYWGSVSLRGADLRGASLDTFPADADMTGARIDLTRVALRQLPELAGALLLGALIVKGGASEARLSPAEYRFLKPFVHTDREPSMPPFDCRRARERFGRMICGEPPDERRIADPEMAALYRKAVAADPSVQRSQKAWLRARWRCPEMGRCLFHSDEQRKFELARAAGEMAWMRPGAAALFVEAPATFDAAFRSHPLYRRLVPVISGAAISRVLVTVRDGGRIDVEGDAVGGADHVCGLEAKGLRLAGPAGWYVGPYEPWEGDAPEWRTRPMPVLRLIGDRAEAYRPVMYEDPRVDVRYILCGARAGFGDMLRLPVGAKQARRLMKVALQ